MSRATAQELERWFPSSNHGKWANLRRWAKRQLRRIRRREEREYCRQPEHKAEPRPRHTGGWLY